MADEEGLGLAGGDSAHLLGAHPLESAQQLQPTAVQHLAAVDGKGRELDVVGATQLQGSAQKEEGVHALLRHFHLDLRIRHPVRGELAGEVVRWQGA